MKRANLFFRQCHFFAWKKVLIILFRNVLELSLGFLALRVVLCPEMGCVAPN